MGVGVGWVKELFLMLTDFYAFIFVGKIAAMTEGGFCSFLSFLAF